MKAVVGAARRASLGPTHIRHPPAPHTSSPTRSWLDLFAGTGAVGIEALSRGVGECHFVEMRWAEGCFEGAGGGQRAAAQLSGLHGLE